MTIQIQTRARLAAAHQVAGKKGSGMANDENSHGKMAAKVAAGTTKAAPLKATMTGAAAQLKKRSALGDVSNVQAQAVCLFLSFSLHGAVQECRMRQLESVSKSLFCRA